MYNVEFTIHIISSQLKSVCEILVVNNEVGFNIWYERFVLWLTKKPTGLN